jgi:hypothetical protein
MQHACRQCSNLQWVLLWQQQERQVLQQQQQLLLALLWVEVLQCRLQLWAVCLQVASVTRRSRRALAALTLRLILQDQQQLQRQQHLLQDTSRHILSKHM